MNIDKYEISKYEIYIKNTTYTSYDCHYFQVSLNGYLLIRYENSVKAQP